MDRQTLAFSWLTAFLSGAAVLVLELTATRALAPFFGQALFVWTNVIGLVLFGLAIGNVLGGRLADRYPRLEILCAILLVAAALVAISAYLPAWVARKLLPDELPLEASYEFLLKGSFITTLVSFVPPVLLLGAVAPFLVRCAATSIERLGTSSGLLYGASTLGSILGTFLTTYLLLPTAGVRGSLLLAAGLLALSSTPLWMACRNTKGAGIAAALGFGVMFLSQTSVGQSSIQGMAQGQLLAVTDSSYQHVEIRYRPDLEATVLALDEGCDSYHSMLPDQGVLTGGYYDYFNLVANAAIDNGALRVLVLGFAGGTHARQLLHFFDELPDLQIVGVELDPAVVELSKKHLDLPDDPRLTVLPNMDARTYLRCGGDPFDLIIVDCYAQQSYLPFHMTSQEFFEEAVQRLREGGFLSINLSGYGAKDPVVEVVTNTMAHALAQPLVSCALPGTINLLVYGQKGTKAPLPQNWNAEQLPEALRPYLQAIQAPVHAWQSYAQEQVRVLTDNSGWLEQLQEERLERRAQLLTDGARQ